MKSFIIKIVGKDTLNEQVSVFCEAFNKNQELESVKSNWKKKHYENPVGNSIIFSAYDGDYMVGINAFMPVRYEYAGKTINAIQSCESGVRLNYRRQGIWCRIMSTAMQYFKNCKVYDVMIGFPNYRNSYSGFMKLGWEDICNMQNMIFINNGPSTVQALLNKKLFLKAGHLLEIEKIAVKFRALSCYEYKVYKYNTPLDVPTNIRCSGCIQLNIDKQWLNWKINYKNMESYFIEKDSRQIAIFLARRRELDNISYCEIVYEINLTNSQKEYENAFVVFMNDILKEKHNNFIRIWTKKEDKQNKLYRKLLFIKTSGHSNPFIVYVLKEDVISKGILYNEKNWALSFMDLD